MKYRLKRCFGAFIEIDRKNGAGGRNRTGTPLREPDFESGASTSSTTPAQKKIGDDITT